MGLVLSSSLFTAASTHSMGTMAGIPPGFTTPAYRYSPPFWRLRSSLSTAFGVHSRPLRVRYGARARETSDTVLPSNRRR